MRAAITQQLINKIKPKNKQYEVWDTKVPGFLLRVNPSGRMNYVCQYRRGRKLTIAATTLMTPAEAREKVVEMLAKANKGEIIERANQQHKSITLGEFIEEHYKPWFSVNRKSGAKAVKRITSCFKCFWKKPLQELDSLMFDKWCEKRQKKNVSKVTINTDIAKFRAALTKAVQWKFLEVNPLGYFKLLKVDNFSPIDRYLTSDEEQRLRDALDARESKIRKKRESANRWRSKRRKPLLPIFEESRFVDEIKPMVLFAINTGIRRSAVFYLRWSDINFERKTVALDAEQDKDTKKRRLPLNSEIMSALTLWRQQTVSLNNKWIFPSPVTGKPRDNVRRVWATLMQNAKIENFRWHDLRHNFASQLVISGKDINIVRQLMCHSDIKMTLRYAHLSPERLAEVVETLVKK